MSSAAQRRLLSAIALVAVGAAGKTAAREPSLDLVLARAASYVVDFQRQLAGIVAEETYVQEAHATRELPATRLPVLPKRVLRSDFLLVKPENAPRYVEFRDVFEVDGRPVRDREERLTRIFLSPSAGGSAQLQAIVNESARYNIGNVTRTMNTPMLPMMFLQPSFRERFRFKRTDDRAPEVARNTASGSTTFRVATELWVIEFRETQPKTIVRTPAGADFPSKGRFWIDPVSGAVLMTELVMSSPDLLAIVDVSYQSEPLLGFLVPVEMRERYHGRDMRVDGTATYGRFRRFDVKTDAALAVPDHTAPTPKRPPPREQ
jgi:hypothetical protein